MATSVSTTFHGLAAGTTFTPAALRGGLLSRSGVVAGSTVNTARPGILPGPTTPLLVTQPATSVMRVKVFAGTVVQATADTPGGVYTHTLTSDTELDIGTAPGSNSRWDVVVAKVFDNGSAPVTTIEVLAGTASASPALPSALTSPAANTYYYPLARVTVTTGTTSITNAMIAFPAAGGGLPAFGQWTVAPGGEVPVASVAAASGLPLYTPFYSTGDLMPGLMLPGGATPLGHMTRYWAGAVTTNASGDISVNFGVKLAGGLTAAPFPNELLAAVAIDAQALGGGGLVIPRWTSNTSTSSTATFRIFDAAGVGVASTTFAFAMMAMGR